MFDLSVEGRVQIFEQVLVPDLLFPVGLHRVVFRLALGFDAACQTLCGKLSPSTSWRLSIEYEDGWPNTGARSPRRGSDSDVNPCVAWLVGVFSDGSSVKEYENWAEQLSEQLDSATLGHPVLPRLPVIWR